MWLLHGPWYSIVVGGATGLATTALLAVVAWGAAAALGSDIGTAGPVLVGLLIGMPTGGYVAGRLGDRSLFQGGMAGLAVAAAIVAISVAGGSPAPANRLIVVFALGLSLGLAGGALALRARASYADDVSSPGDRGLRPEESPDSTGQDAG